MQTDQLVNAAMELFHDHTVSPRGVQRSGATAWLYAPQVPVYSMFLKGVLGTRFGSLQLKIGSLESDKIIKGNIYEI